MYDLDHFKNINDRFGHGTGDWALKEVAEASKGFCRRIDVLGRLGGEEFAILMYGCDLRAAARVAEDCRVRLAQIDTGEWCRIEWWALNLEVLAHDRNPVRTRREATGKVMSKSQGSFNALGLGGD